jgi:polyphosphate glucokinase
MQADHPAPLRSAKPNTREYIGNTLDGKHSRKRTRTGVGGERRVTMTMLQRVRQAAGYCGIVGAMKRVKKHRVLAIDVGGSHVKMRVSNRRDLRQFVSGPDLTPKQMVARVHEVVGDWTFTAVSIGYPGIVMHGKIVTEPYNLGRGWVGYDFREAFGRPTRLINDAAMQAIGSYRGGRMLFLGLGTGMGSAMVVDGVVEAMELAHLTYKKGRTYEDYVGDRGRSRLGPRKWRRAVHDIVGQLRIALEVDYVVLGGGNARKLKKLPEGARLGNNDFAFIGGFRMWRPGGIFPARGTRATG